MENQQSKFIVVAYYTPDVLYKTSACRLVTSLREFSVPYYIESIPSMGDWYANTNYKPTFLKRMLLKFALIDVVYVDCDAEFLKYPSLFDIFSGDVGVYVFDRSEYGRGQQGKEVLSGTIYLKNSPTVFDVVCNWEEECKENPRVWDQKSLEKVLAGKYTLLPGEYCKIFDRMKFVKDPVIVHYQISRKVKNKKAKEACRILSKSKDSSPQIRQASIL